MAEERVQRRLAAILAADVVGYSRMMSHDEVGTLSRLAIAANQRLTRPARRPGHAENTAVGWPGLGAGRIRLNRK